MKKSKNPVWLLRTKAKLSQKKLAEISGIKQPQISKLEGESSNPTLKTIEKIRNAIENYKKSLV